MIITLGGRIFDPEIPDTDGDIFNITDAPGLFTRITELIIYALTNGKDQVSYGRMGGRAITLKGYAFTPIKGLNKSRLPAKLEAYTAAVYADATMRVQQARYGTTAVPGQEIEEDEDGLDVTIQVRRSAEIRTTPVDGGHVMEFEVPLAAADPTMTAVT